MITLVSSPWGLGPTLMHRTVLYLLMPLIETVCKESLQLHLMLVFCTCKNVQQRECDLNSCKWSSYCIRCLDLFLKDALNKHLTCLIILQFNRPEWIITVIRWSFHLSGTKKGYQNTGKWHYIKILFKMPFLNLMLNFPIYFGHA